MNKEVYRLIYVSSASQLLSEDELEGLLRGSRERNNRRGITGVLLYCEGNFIQVLEGEESVVEALYSKITNDPRHKGVIRLMSEKSTKRDFPNWSMGFRRVSSTTPKKDIEGFNDLVDKATLKPQELAHISEKVRHFIHAFRRTSGLQG